MPAHKTKGSEAALWRRGRCPGAETVRGNSCCPPSEQLVEQAFAVTRDGHRYVVALEPAGGIEVSARWSARRIVERDRRAEVGSAQHFLAFRNDAEQRRREDFENVLDIEHLAAGRALGVVARDEDVLLDALSLLGLLGLRIEQPDDAIGVADRRHFRIG